MVEINNQRKAFLDMLAWSGGTDNGRQKNWNHGCIDVIVSGNYLLITPITLANLSTLNPKLKSTGAGHFTNFFPVGGMPAASSLAWRLLSEKSGRCGVTADWGGALPMIDRGDIRQAIDRCSNIWASLPGAGYGQFEHKAAAWLQDSKEAGGTVREIDVASHRVISLWFICIVCLSWAVNHYRDNAITYKAQRDKNARELKLANAAITDMQMRQRVAALDAKYTKELAWC